MQAYNFNKENHTALTKTGYQIVREGWNSEGDVVVTYQNHNTFDRKSLLRPDSDEYTGIVAKWECETIIVEPQDEAMDQFRKLFKLVAGCKVSEDGKLMTYQMGTVASAARWVSEAQGIISVNRLPLDASVKAYQRKGETAPHKVELRIVYKPKDI